MSNSTERSFVARFILANRLGLKSQQREGLSKKTFLSTFSTINAEIIQFKIKPYGFSGYESLHVRLQTDVNQRPVYQSYVANMIYMFLSQFE